MNFLRSLKQYVNQVSKVLPISNRQVPALSSKLLQNHFTEDRRYNSTCTRFKGKVAIVTASTEGIGYAIAKRLAEEGASVVVSSRKEQNVEKATKSLKDLGFNVLGLTCHVSKKEDRDQLFAKTLETFGGVDILVSNAAINPVIGGTLKCTEEEWDKIFEVNVKNTFQLTQAVVPLMKKRNGGSVVYISTIGAYYLPNFYMIGPYCISKTALLGLTKAVAQEVAPDNIRINCVAPGAINTKFSHQFFANEQLMKEIMGSFLMKRLAKPEEISGVVAFLCSDDASYVTGETIVAAGGAQSHL